MVVELSATTCVAIPVRNSGAKQKPSRTEKPSRRDRIFSRDEYRCAYCARVLHENELTLDHVEPRLKGGDRSDGNLVTCCRPCNAAKAGTPAWAFLAWQPERRANFMRYARSVWPRLRRAIEEAAEDR